MNLEKPNQSSKTPMMQQYESIKSKHKDTILLFHLGDFYEMFMEDAYTAARILNLALTKRQTTPMCGFPQHAANSYIQKLVEAGLKVAICDQVEAPSPEKKLVKREVVEVITPGTIVDQDFLRSEKSNFLLTFQIKDHKISLLFADVLTGDMFAIVSPYEDNWYRILSDECSRFNPVEILYPASYKDDPKLMKLLKEENIFLTPIQSYYYQDTTKLEEYFKKFPDLKDTLPILLTQTITALFSYLKENYIHRVYNFKKVELLNFQNIMELDDFTIQNLELIQNTKDRSIHFTLLETLKKTVTPMGFRLLSRWVVAPLLDKLIIQKRQRFTMTFVSDPLLRARVVDILQGIKDIDRITSRIALYKVLPLELWNLMLFLKETDRLKILLSQNEDFKKLVKLIPDFLPLIHFLETILQKEPPSQFEGKVIREGYDTKLDMYRKILEEGKTYLINMQQEERGKTGISTLKIKYNKITGYFIEVSKAQIQKVPNYYQKRQSLVNVERFVTEELINYEQQIAQAAEKVQSLEEEIFKNLVSDLQKEIVPLQMASKIIGEIDIYQSFAKCAELYDYICPEIVDEDILQIENGRHPVVEKLLKKGDFISNDTFLDEKEKRIMILTGPNMAGKSTYLRQTALIVILAQIGAFVPASFVKMGLVDRIFTRIGASDEISKGKSTFFVEMDEVARLLTYSTKKSLLIIDELGRGTTTYDGLALVQAVLEYLSKTKKAKTLFSTHYHELSSLDTLEGIFNQSMAVKDTGKDLIFLRKVVSGAASQSYGIYVAKLAGLSDQIVYRATEILKDLEKDKKFTDINGSLNSNEKRITDHLFNLDLQTITPIEALKLLSWYQELLKEK